jgi:hypothetical protein
MKSRYITMVVASVLLTVGLIPLGSAQSVPGVRPLPAGIEVITVVAKRPAPTVASTCVNEVLAGRDVNAQTPESRHANRDGIRQAIKDCIEQAQMGTANS